MNSAGTSWISLIGATPVVLVLLTWSISRQRNHEKLHEQNILSRGNATKYIIILKTILSLQLSIQFIIFLYSLLYKLLSIEHYAFLLIFLVQTLTLVKSLLSLSLVLLNSVSISSAFVKYHITLLFALSGSIHVPVVLHELNELLSTPIDFRLFVYFMIVHSLVTLGCVSLVLTGIFKFFCIRCSNVGCEEDCSCSWRHKTCISLMIVCVLCSDVVFIVTSLLGQYPEFNPVSSGSDFDQSSAVLWAQVFEGVIIVLLLDPISQCHSRKRQIRLLESPSSSYHLSDTRLNGGRRHLVNQGIKFPITNGSLFASLTAVAMSRGHYAGGFDLKSNDMSESQENTLDKFKTYTKEVDCEETHSVTTIANDDFEFHNHIPQCHKIDNSKDSPVNLSLFESASMNDLDSVQSSCHHTRLYKKNSKFPSSSSSSCSNNNNSNNNNTKSERKVFRRAQSCESLPSAGVLERSYLDNGGYCEHYDEKVVFVTDFI